MLLQPVYVIILLEAQWKPDFYLEYIKLFSKSPWLGWNLLMELRFETKNKIWDQNQQNEACKRKVLKKMPKV